MSDIVWSYHTILDIVYTYIKINDNLKNRKSLGPLRVLYISSILWGCRTVWGRDFVKLEEGLENAPNARMGWQNEFERG
jgi:hypothetical protein